MTHFDYGFKKEFLAGKLVRKYLGFILFLGIILVLCIFNGCSPTPKKQRSELKTGNIIQIECYNSDIEHISSETINQILKDYDRDKYIIKIRFWNEDVPIIIRDDGGVYIEKVSTKLRCSDLYIFKPLSQSNLNYTNSDMMFWFAH